MGIQKYIMAEEEISRKKQKTLRKESLEIK